MNIIMETDQRKSLSDFEKLQMSPKPLTCEDSGVDILLDTFFDHTRPLDSNALDALLNTKFNTDFEEIDDEPSTSEVTASWRPAQSGLVPQDRPASNAVTESSASYEKHQSAHTSSPFTFSPQSPNRPSTHATSGHHNHSYHNNLNSPIPYHGLPTMQPSHLASLGQIPDQMDRAHYYPTSAPVAMPTMTAFYSDMNNGLHPPRNVSRQSTADLMDYENTIPEENEAAGTIDGDNDEPCYAILLFNCLLEAPGHILVLQDIYKWILKYSRKARDSTGTGWQNSVRHNLSMNEAFERVASSGLHGTKKNFLWRLTDQALQNGVISTTRYRKEPKRKPQRRGSPALKRQQSGAKGGQATRAASAHRKALQARGLVPQTLNNLEMHRRNILKQEPAFPSMISSPSLIHASSSPHPGLAEPALPSYFRPNTPVAASRYFLQPVEQSIETDSYAMGRPQSLSNPHTPPEIHVGYSLPTKQSPPTTYGSPSGGYVNEFELAYHDPSMGLFGNHDELTPNTPSLGTEMSFTADEMTPLSTLSVSCEPMRS